MVRTPANRRRCTFPHCNNTDRLHNVERKIRFKALKQNKICIPDGARVCEQHLQMNVWSALNGNTEQLAKFSAKQVEDMIQLLTDSRSEIAPEFPGSYVVCNNGTECSQVGVVLICFYSSGLKIAVSIPKTFSEFSFKDTGYSYFMHLCTTFLHV